MFYRGTEYENQNETHIMNVQSWTPNIQTAKMFGSYIYKTIAPVKAVELSNIFYWHGLVYNNHDGLGDSQAEWFLLNPKKTLIKNYT